MPSDRLPYSHNATSSGWVAMFLTVFGIHCPLFATGIPFRVRTRPAFGDGMPAGAHPFLQKPLVRDVLVRTVAGVVGRRP